MQFDTTNPPGDEMEAAQRIADQLKERKITDDVTVYEPAPRRGLVIGHIAGSEPLKPLVLSHHMDVVPADPAQWSCQPFAGEVSDGYVWGRGAFDDKNMGVIHLLALERLVGQGVTFRRPVIFLAVPDEECGGSHGTEWLVENHLDELDPEWVWDEGGGRFTGLIGDSPVFGVAVAEKQTQHLRLIASGEAGHGSMPHRNNANVILMNALERILRPRPLRINTVSAAIATSSKSYVQCERSGAEFRVHSERKATEGCTESTNQRTCHLHTCSPAHLLTIANRRLRAIMVLPWG